ncbi:MAG: hypothetical protein AMS22_04615 [Thiotrichales bacterium SG8_50]|jgi:hypothetical protein|nr:MAG: hypothetical protein AMS22_04615 [Thiotrichales bacterium SG8_50]
MRKLHIAIGVLNIEATVQDYSVRFGRSPEVVVANEYALWRTDTLNFSVRKVSSQESGQLRHLGWEDASCSAFTVETDVNGVLWEHFSPEQQAKEIKETWPGAAYSSQQAEC